jgi:hypothetical protein
MILFNFRASSKAAGLRLRRKIASPEEHRGVLGLLIVERTAINKAMRKETR